MRRNQGPKRRKSTANHNSERAQLIARAIQLSYDSLQSHLPYTDGDRKVSFVEKSTFHKKCIREYSELIKILSLLY